MIVLSIDGFPGYYLNSNSPFSDKMPTLKSLIKKSTFSKNVQTTNPSITYPAHTSMLTGVDPLEHNILFNTPLDPFKKYNGSWLWYDSDIRVKTIFDKANEKKLVTASIYWPVTVGANIKYNIPQYWKNKTDEDEKLLAALSTRGLYEEIKNYTKKSVLETTGDEEKIKAGLAVWKLKKPDVLFIYTTDLDSIHHEKGVYSKEAGLKLKKIDSLLSELIKEVNLFKDKNISLVIISDHGFREVKSLCYPNRILIEKNFIDIKNQTWTYYFKTYGGGAILLENPNKSFFSEDIQLESLKKDLESKCPGSNFDIADELNKYKLEFHSDSLAVLNSTNGMAFSESLSSGDSFKEANPTYYNHGFPSDQKEMKTIGIVYPSNKENKMQSVKDVFMISCKWLNLNCKLGERR